jgi:hypothetical protein
MPDTGKLYHRTCDGNACILTRGEGTNECSTHLDCEGGEIDPWSHPSIDAPNPGENEPSTQKRVCKNGQCVVESGDPKDSTCNTDVDCVPSPPTETGVYTPNAEVTTTCNGDQCVLRHGPTEDGVNASPSCYSSEDCGGEESGGNATDTCGDDICQVYETPETCPSDCPGVPAPDTHAECVSGACVIKAGAGENECSAGSLCTDVGTQPVFEEPFTYNTGVELGPATHDADTTIEDAGLTNVTYSYVNRDVHPWTVASNGIDGDAAKADTGVDPGQTSTFYLNLNLEGDDAALYTLSFDYSVDLPSETELVLSVTRRNRLGHFAHDQCVTASGEESGSFKADTATILSTLQNNYWDLFSTVNRCSIIYPRETTLKFSLVRETSSNAEAPDPEAFIDNIQVTRIQ